MLTEYLLHYNTARPHRALGQLAPAQAHTRPPQINLAEHPDPSKTSPRRTHARVPDRRLTASRCYKKRAGHLHDRVFEPHRVEIVRRRVQFLDLGNKQENLRLVNCLSKISSVFTSPSFANSMFRIFRGDQRAIGEIMIYESADGELACIGYAEFCTRMDIDPSFARWLARLSNHIEQLATTDAPQSRLAVLQCDVIDLIDILDPECRRFPDRSRRKLPDQMTDQKLHRLELDPHTERPPG